MLSSSMYIGCEMNPLLFRNEKKDDGLRTLNTAGQRKTILNRFPQVSCRINISSSWYIGCFGEKVPLGTIKIFLLEWISPVKRPAYFIKVSIVSIT